MRADSDVVMFWRTIVVAADNAEVVVAMIVVVVVLVVAVVVVVVVVMVGKFGDLILESFLLGSGSSSKITKDFPLFKFPCHINFILPCSKIQFE